MMIAVRLVASVSILYAMGLFTLVLRDECKRKGQRRWGLAWWLNTATVICFASPVALLWL